MYEGSNQQSLPNARTPQTAYSVTPEKHSTSPSTTAKTVQSYLPPQPGASIPKPTPFVLTSQKQSAPAPTRTRITQQDPRALQPGATPVPTPISSLTQPKATMGDLPPPPKVGEKPLPPEYYTSATPTRVTQPQSYPPQMSIPPLSAPNFGQPPASTTSSASQSSYPPGTMLPLAYQQPTPTRPIPHPSDEVTRRLSLEHPPGYVQNAYATDMTPDQRFATEQMSNESGSSVLGYGDTRRGGIAKGDDETLWETAMKIAKGAGEKVGEFEKTVWEKIEHISGK